MGDHAVRSWYDAETGELVPEAEIADRYHDTVVENCGIRRYVDDGAMIENTAPLLTSVFLDKDLSFVVSTEAEALAFVEPTRRTRLQPRFRTAVTGRSPAVRAPRSASPAR